jgi:hypothetical protein
LQNAQRQRLRVLRHEEDVTGPFLSHLVDKLGEALCVSKIQRGIGFAAMAVPTRYESLVATVRQVHDSLILRPTANTAEFEGMQELAVAAKERP